MAAARRLRLLGSHVASSRPCATTDDAAPLSVTPEQESVSAGSSAAFIVSWPGHAAAPFRWKLTKDGEPLGDAAAGDAEGTGTLDGSGRAEITGALHEPGCLRCEVWCGGDDAVAAVGGAAVSPLEIPPSLPPPQDFDTFWAAKKAELDAAPPNIRLRPLQGVEEGGTYTAAGTGDLVEPSGREAVLVPGVEAFEVEADSSVGAGVSAYLARPANAEPRSLPAILCVHGAGVYSSDLESAVRWATGGGPDGKPRGPAAIAMDMNAHGIANGQPEEYYAGLGSGQLADYRAQGRADRESCYFLSMLLRLVRGIDVLTAQPAWDGRTVAVYGVSQGGLQAIAAAGLDSRVTFFAAGVPAGCDHTGHLATPSPRTSGWPQIAQDAAPEEQAAVDEAVRYFDCVNFASRATAPSQWSVGLIDPVCPPTSVFAAFNSLPAGNVKAMHVDAWAGHEHTPGADGAMRGAVMDHFRAMGHPDLS